MAKTYREQVEDMSTVAIPNMRPEMGFTVCRTIAAVIASEADAELAACRARIAELEADAGRYRWLREKRGEWLDAAIDVAALNSKKEST